VPFWSKKSFEISSLSFTKLNPHPYQGNLLPMHTCTVHPAQSPAKTPKGKDLSGQPGLSVTYDKDEN